MRAILRPLPLLAVAAIAAACSGDRGNLAPGQPVAVTRFRAEPYSLTYYSALRQPGRLVIRDRATWQAAWTAMLQAGAAPAVDFDREMVVVAASGEHPTGGYSILVDAATESSDGLTIRIRSSKPGLSCFVTAAFSQPVDAARLPRTDGPVHFSDVSTVLDCR